MEQCIYCQSVYKLKESTSSKPIAFCSVECEKAFNDDPISFEKLGMMFSKWVRD
ncbi:hypothetical protein [Halalkalibacterium halodurans]|uniref:hypothetical protein n=1 Tax=Halalkalibacterium halodurans TaxID=86665 RepID=UPI002AAA05B8|nr:hypothetical protein [Halalkalibacterium halodurans]MDY7224683.1 hypothetical protein [Halalkalibacterium halodurans]MDY7243267.1 hypothetical protein [Halalkalibacterium halodurans]